MHKHTLKLAALCAPMLGMAATPVRAGFDAAVVPAEAQWVFYLDLQTMRSSALGTEMMALVPAIDLDSEELPVKVSIPKIIESIGSATAYGTNFSEDPAKMNGALVVRGTEDLRKIVQAFLLAGSTDDSGKSEMDIKELTGLGFDAYQIENEVIVALPPGDAILVSKSRESLDAARALLASDKGSLARAKSPVLAPLIPKSGRPYLLAASLVPRENDLLSGNRPEARILQMASAASVAIGEDGPMTTARIQIDATSADMADKLVKILQGLAAGLSFFETDDDALAEFLRSVRVEKTSSGALLNLAYPTDRLVVMLKALHEEQVREHTSHHGDDDDGGPARPAAAQGRVISEWRADKDISSDRPTPDNIVTQTIEKVALTTGQFIWLNSSRDDGENGRFDYVDITPTNRSSAPVRFEAENMRLENFQVEEVPFASGGEVIILRNRSGSARFAFPGSAGTYTLTVAYVDETDGQSAYSISITDPKPQPGPEAPKP